VIHDGNATYYILLKEGYTTNKNNIKIKKNLYFFYQLKLNIYIKYV